MSEVLIQESTLSAIGDAIRSKTGSTNLMSPAEMATAVNGIQVGGAINSKDITNLSKSTASRTFGNKNTHYYGTSAFSFSLVKDFVFGILCFQGAISDGDKSGGYYPAYYKSAALITLNDINNITSKYDAISFQNLAFGIQHDYDPKLKRVYVYQDEGLTKILNNDTENVSLMFNLTNYANATTPKSCYFNQNFTDNIKFYQFSKS